MTTRPMRAANHLLLRLKVKWNNVLSMKYAPTMDLILLITCPFCARGVRISWYQLDN